MPLQPDTLGQQLQQQHQQQLRHVVLVSVATAIVLVLVLVLCIKLASMLSVGKLGVTTRSWLHLGVSN